ncbi:MAG: transcriptional regulator [Chloroflexi bacterium]|jgi:hypothetical protein|nr:MAG: transcriptional regulator [Chloroflexota bacterium]
MTQPAPASPVYWRFNPEVFRLIGIKCNDCGHISYPRTMICHECGSLNLEEYKLAKKGTVHTYCVNWAPPPNFEPPITPVIVDLEGGGRYQGLMTETATPEDVKVNSKVEMVLRKLITDRGLNVYGYKFRLVEED